MCRAFMLFVLMNTVRGTVVVLFSGFFLFSCLNVSPSISATETNHGYSNTCSPEKKRLVFAASTGVFCFAQRTGSRHASITISMVASS